MIHDFNQPAKRWLADHLENHIALIEKGQDPSCVMTIGPVEIEIRLNKAPGLFERKRFATRKVNLFFEHSFCVSSEANGSAELNIPEAVIDLLESPELSWLPKYNREDVVSTITYSMISVAKAANPALGLDVDQICNATMTLYRAKFAGQK